MEKMSQSGKTVPQIRFQGEWLKMFGFSVGDKIKLDCEKNRIVITKLSENNK